MGKKNDIVERTNVIEFFLHHDVCLVVVSESLTTAMTAAAEKVSRPRTTRLTKIRKQMIFQLKKEK